ncbi:MAG: hypothetical protein R3D29_09790 [Nitratireductor sp.]
MTGFFRQIVDQVNDRRSEVVDLTCDLHPFPTVNLRREAYTPQAEYLGRRTAEIV